MRSASPSGSWRSAPGRSTATNSAEASRSRAAARLNGPKLSNASLVAGSDPPHIRFNSTSATTASPGVGTASSRDRMPTPTTGLESITRRA